MTLFVSSLLVGCGGSLTEEEKKIVGSYEETLGEETCSETHRWVFLENGSYEKHVPEMDAQEGTWDMQEGFHDVLYAATYEKRKVKHKELHAKDGKGYTVVFRVNPDRSLNSIGGIENGNRMQIPGDLQDSYKRLK